MNNGLHTQIYILTYSHLHYCGFGLKNNHLFKINVQSNIDSNKHKQKDLEKKLRGKE